MKLAVVVGARPQFIKLAPLVRLLPDSLLIHTGQHYDRDMSAQFFEELELPKPAYSLDVGSGAHGAQTGQMMERLEPVLERERPDRVLVFGDTNSTLAGALVASKLHLPVAHVEAGLRSFNRAMPEEINRVVADHLSDLLFAPTPVAVANLAREGITRGVHMVGDIMADATRLAMARPITVESPPEPFYLLTLHRAETTDQPERLLSVLRALDGQPSPVLFPCHPRTRQVLDRLGFESEGALRRMAPVGHRHLLELARRARLVLTDSGGLQKEAFLVGTGCVTLRTETEWVETVEAGWNRLVGLDPEALLQAMAERPASDRPDLYGDGHTAERIREVLSHSRKKELKP